MISFSNFYVFELKKGKEKIKFDVYYRKPEKLIVILFTFLL